MVRRDQLILATIYAVAKLVLQKIAAGFWEQKCTGLQTLIWSLAKLLDLLAGASSGVHLALLCGKESWTAAVGLVYWVALHFVGRKLTDAPRQAQALTWWLRTSAPLC